ncbi:MAG: 50S ribosomal protein L13 [Candidatus Liptonbacteria bacterium RIFCSPLOWO2_01_FULL_52_25]|uniref:Large ribosomal subunit protein uL13 n=1 Tax=Candidatus Liptonbacteria bacterium RIFCSPLOWO2_01_FULL_52_25 TaxID=1798650 RepID=A0A1G2CDP2_9BACT|nr:MAG: 50S ribosomal protein L13 [Candidatus Liptonbacteria bacterium RIFCSPLOWO2_01_FULL_52_25]
MDYNIDAKNKILGRLASEIAAILQGKKSAKYNPRLIGEDRALVSNFEGVKVTGAKMKDKVYYKHTGYVGHLKEMTLEQMFAKDPKRVLREAVRRMLPKNFLNQKRMKNLVFIDK